MQLIAGHHHLSMYTKDANQNNYFYQKILGLRRVKKTVNQDDPSMYHLFYGDQTGTPGTELTFFELPRAGRTHRGTNAITQIGLLVQNKAALEYWQTRFEKYQVQHGSLSVYRNLPALSFQDPEGLRMMLIASSGQQAEQWQVFEKSPIPAQYQIQGIGTVEMTVQRPEKLARMLTELFGYTEISRSANETIFQSVPGEMRGEIAVKDLEGPDERPGRGSVHHLAIRVSGEKELEEWEKKIQANGFRTSGIIDRFYFKSLYFRESNGILFELATDGPGFAVDSDIETLGEKLDLPPFLENKRAEIEAGLKPIEK